jgi:hypothetical protein
MQSLRTSYLLLSTTSMLALAGCGGAGSKDPTGYSISAQLSVVQDLSPEERAIATRICYAYQSKSSGFRGQSYNAGSFIYKIESKNCVDAQADYTVNAVLKATTSSMVMEPDTDKPFQKVVQTDTAGYLSQLCAKIKNNKVISNTVTETSTKIQIKFFKDTFDSYTLRYFNPTGTNGELKITSAETLKVRTDSGTGILGMDEKYTIQQTCGTSDKFSEFNQTFSAFK